MDGRAGERASGKVRKKFHGADLSSKLARADSIRLEKEALSGDFFFGNLLTLYLLKQDEERVKKPW